MDLQLLGKLLKMSEPRPTPEYATHLDSWMNSSTGIGTGRDKLTSTSFQGSGRLMPSLLEDLYHNDDVAARVCDLFPETALREPFQLSDTGLQKEIETLGIFDSFEEGWVWGRLHGAGPVLLGGAGATNIQLTTGVESLTVVDRYTLSVAQTYPRGTPKYGQPELYRVMYSQWPGIGNNPEPIDPNETIHESRVIIFPGARTSPRRRRANGYWDDSVLQRVYQVVQSYGLTWGSVMNLLQDTAQGVYKIKDMWSMIISNNKDMIDERMREVDEQRSSARAITLDADNEDFSRVPTPFTAIPELIDRMSERLAAASGYPLTVLMGSSPAGMNATGQSDLELHYGRTEVQRRRVLTPAIHKLVRGMGQDPEKITITYPPLWIPNALDTAKTRYATAQSDNIYHEMGLPAEVIIKSRFKTTGWSPETRVPADVKLEPPMSGPGAPTPGGGGSLGAGGTAIGTRHYSPKYGR